MTVYVNLRLSPKVGSSAPVVTSARVNTGFGSAVPELAVSTKLAEALGFWPDLPAVAYLEPVQQAGGSVDVHIVPGGCEVEAVEADRSTGPVLANVLILPPRRDPLMSDHLVEALQIEVVRPGTGTWRFRGEGDRERPSARPQLW